MCPCAAVRLWSGRLLLARWSSPPTNLNAGEMKIKRVPTWGRDLRAGPRGRRPQSCSSARVQAALIPVASSGVRPQLPGFPGKAPKNVNASVTYVSVPSLLALSGRAQEDAETFLFPSLLPGRLCKTPARCLLNGLRVACVS